jgi:hypothetical protein
MAMPPWAAVEVLAAEEEVSLRVTGLVPRIATWPRRRPRWLRRPRWRTRRHREGEGVVEAGEGPLLLLGADDDGHRELLLLGELERDIEVLAKLGHI